MSLPSTRRQFLQLGTIGLSIGMTDLLRAGTATPEANRSAILVYLPGGPSHIDTFDPKPDAPHEIRGEFGTVATTVPGVRFSEHLPRLATMLDRFALLRAVTGMSEEHLDATVMTGYTSVAMKAAGHPSLGAIVSKHRGTVDGTPPFVSLRGMSLGCEPGYLGVPHRPYYPGGQSDADLKLPPGISPERFTQRRALLANLDVSRGPLSDEQQGMEAFQQQAFELVSTGRIRSALNISREPAEVQERFSGVEAFLKARRLVEAGVSCVTLSVGRWDTHKNNFSSLKEELPALDQGMSELIADLHERGLADRTIVVVWGEFGRTPRVNSDAGRDHWPPVMSALLAGGGLTPGAVIGETTPWGDQPKSGKCTVQQVLATILRQIGISPESTLPNGDGRPVRLLEDSAPIEGLQ